jgi:hypothetical protein
MSALGHQQTSKRHTITSALHSIAQVGLPQMETSLVRANSKAEKSRWQLDDVGTTGWVKNRARWVKSNNPPFYKPLISLDDI